MSAHKIKRKPLSCLFCKSEAADELHANLICDTCYQPRFQMKFDLFMRQMSSCMVCVEAMYNGLKRTKHNCTQAGVFVCAHCDMVFAEKSDLEVHMENRLERYTCRKCCVYFCNENGLNKHNDSHGGSDSVCLVRGKDVEIERTSKIHDDDRPYKCQICGHSFKTLIRLNKHTVIHGDKQHKCPHCEKSFHRLDSIKSHITTVHENKRKYKCQLCDKSYKDSGCLIFHMSVHEKEIFRCKPCGKPFFNETELKKHNDHQFGGCSDSIGWATAKWSRPRNKPVCDICKKSFINKYYIQKHMLTHYPKEKSVQCKTCKKYYSSPSLLQSHMLIHENKKQYKCERCDKSFNNFPNLYNHILVHENRRLYQCEICDKSFNQGSNLIHHMDTHRTEKEYKCQQCEKSFQHSRSLRSHRAVHDDSKWHKCQHCDKKFKRIDNLKEHINNHENKRAFKCQRCKMSFNNISNLRRHMIHHKNKRNYKCQFCFKAYNISTHLKQHIARNHSEKSK